jgi:hypothetical protein
VANVYIPVRVREFSLSLTERNENVHSKHEYFNEHLKIERDELNALKQKINKLKEDAAYNININDIFIS